MLAKTSTSVSGLNVEGLWGASEQVLTSNGAAPWCLESRYRYIKMLLQMQLFGYLGVYGAVGFMRIMGFWGLWGLRRVRQGGASVAVVSSKK